MNEKFIEWFIKEIPTLTEKGIITTEIAHNLNEYYINKLAELKQPKDVPQQTAPSQQLAPEFSELIFHPSSGQKSEKTEITETTKNTEKSPAKKTPKLSVSVILIQQEYLATKDHHTTAADCFDHTVVLLWMCTISISIA